MSETSVFFVFFGGVQAVSTDAKKGKPQKSKRLWLDGGGGRPRGGGGGYSGDYREERMGGGASRVRERARKPRVRACS
jgi:hypothetical protein